MGRAFRMGVIGGTSARGDHVKQERDEAQNRESQSATRDMCR